MGSVHTFILLGLIVNCFQLVPASSSYSQLLRQFDVEPLSNVTDTELRDYHPERTMSEVSRCLLPSDCRDLQRCDNTKSGVYRIFPYNVGKGFLVYCDMVTDGGGWLVFQRRQDGTVNFYRKWQSYKHGFGNLYGEFWLGLEKIHILSSKRQTELLVNLGRFDGATGWAKYGRFRVADERGKYRLLAESFTGNVGDAMAVRQNGMAFSTYDSDSDTFSENCASRFRGAWWYSACYYSNLNGEYLHPREQSDFDKEAIIVWYQWRNKPEPLQFVEMKMRPVDVS